MRALVIVGIGVLTHITLGRWVSSPWLMPDLTGLSMTLAILRLPGHPLLPAWVAGLCAMVLAVHHPLTTVLAYLATGAAVKWIAHQGEVREPSRERLVVALAQGLLLAMLMSTGPLTISVILMALVQLGLTLVCLPLMRVFVDRVAVQ